MEPGLARPLQASARRARVRSGDMKRVRWDLARGLLFPVIVLALAAVACGDPAGETNGNNPGGTTVVDPGAGYHSISEIAVEPGENRIWLVHEGNWNGVPGPQSRALLASVDTGSGVARDLFEVTTDSTREIGFPWSGRA